MVPSNGPSNFFILRICLGFAYFAKTENFLLKLLWINVKVSRNSIVRLMNSTKKCRETHE